MSATELQRKIGLRAAWAFLALALGWLAPVVTLASFVPDVCKSECCIAEGHCCCTPRHALVEGQVPDGREQLDAPRLSRPCPNNCATPITPGATDTHVATGAPLHPFEITDDDLPLLGWQVIAYTSLRHSPSSPRGPPARS
jgi:hypothetical protein